MSMNLFGKANETGLTGIILEDYQYDQEKKTYKKVRISAGY